MYDIKTPKHPISRFLLERLYLRKCSQLERAKACENVVRYGVFKAEAELLKQELDKLALH